MDKSSFELSIDTQILIGELMKAEVGDVIEYDALSKVLGRNVRTVAAGNLRSARKIVQRDEEIVFGAIRGIGLKRLGDEAIACSGESSIKRIHRESIRGRKRLETVRNFAALPAEVQVAHNASMSLLGALQQGTRPRTQQRIETRVREVHDKLALAQTLALFAGTEVDST